MRTPAESSPPTAVVLRDLGLGDLLVAVPALRLLRAALPDHRIVLVAPTSLGSLVARISDVDEHVGDVPPGPVDIAVNLHGRGPQSHARLDRASPRRRIGHAAAGWDGPVWTEDPHRPERRRWCDLLVATGLVDADTARAGVDDLRLLRNAGARGTLAPPSGARVPLARTAGGPVVVHPGAAYGAKRWPAERFAACASALVRGGRRAVVTGSDGERALTSEVAARAGLPPAADLGGRTDVEGLADLVAGAALVLCGDTGVAHLATAFGVPSVVLFGPVGPAQWGPPPGGPHVVLTDPAARRGDRFVDDPDPALLAVTPGDVLAAAAGLLAP